MTDQTPRALSDKTGFIGPLDVGDERCPVCGLDPLDPTLHGDGCPTIDTPAQFPPFDTIEANR